MKEKKIGISQLKFTKGKEIYAKKEMQLIQLIMFIQKSKYL